MPTGEVTAQQDLASPRQLTTRGSGASAAASSAAATTASATTTTTTPPAVGTGHYISWKKPHLSQSRTRERLMSLLGATYADAAPGAMGVKPEARTPHAPTPSQRVILSVSTTVGEALIPFLFTFPISASFPPPSSRYIPRRVQYSLLWLSFFPRDNRFLFQSQYPGFFIFVCRLAIYFTHSLYDHFQFFSRGFMAEISLPVYALSFQPLPLMPFSMDPLLSIGQKPPSTSLFCFHLFLSYPSS